jgi:hypothetical protein
MEGGTTSSTPAAFTPYDYSAPLESSNLPKELLITISRVKRRTELLDEEAGGYFGRGSAMRRGGKDGVDPKEFFARPQYGLSPGYKV